MSPDVSAVSRTEAGLAVELRVSVGRLARRLRAERDEGVPGVGMMSVLAALHREGDLTVGQLAEHDRVKPPSMTRTVSCLESDGYVVRRPAETDRRQVIVSLTQEGRQVLLATRRRREAWLAQRLRSLTAEEKTLLRDALPILERLSRE